MNEWDRMDKDRIRKRSKQAAGISVFGVIVVLAAFGFAAMRLYKLDHEIEEKTTTLQYVKRQARQAADALLVKEQRLDEVAEQLLTTDEQLHSTREMLGTRQKELRFQRARLVEVEQKKASLRDSVDHLNLELAQKAEDVIALNRAAATKQSMLDELDQKMQVLLREKEKIEQSLRAYDQYVQFMAEQSSQKPGSGDRKKSRWRPWGDAIGSNGLSIIPRASFELHGTDTYHFRVWLDIPDKLKATVEEVTYFFNHKSFRTPQVTVRSEENGFSTEYTGWGCLDNMPIVVSMKSGEQRTLAFQMCRYLSESGPDEEIPVKGNGGTDSKRPHPPSKGG